MSEWIATIRSQVSTNLPRALGRERWSVANGRVFRSRVCWFRDEDGSVGYEAEIGYAYIVDGIEYAGRRVAKLGRIYDDPEAAKAAAERFPRGAEVAVYYQADAPADALLERPQGAWIG